MRKIVFDIETKNIFSDVGSNNPADLDLSLLAIYDSETNEYSSYLEEDLPKLWPILEKADLLIGFNSDHFDIPLLNKYYPGDLTKIKSVDILKSVKDSCGRRYKLDNIAHATLGHGKAGNGLEALVWWRNGEIEKVRKYCIEDVRITKELYDYVLKNGHLKCNDGNGFIDIKIDTSDWGNKNNVALTHTLPF
jgi:hypothetical protein